MYLILLCVFSFQQQSDTESIYNDLYTSPQQAIQRVDELGLTPYLFGQKLIYLGPEKAIAWFRAMEELDPKEINVYRFGTAWVHFTQKKIPRAEKELRTILLKNPKDGVLRARIAYLWGQIELDKGNFNKADAYFDESLQLYHNEGLVGGKANCVYAKGRVGLLNDRLADAQNCFDQASQLNAQNTSGKIDYQIHLANALIRMKTGDYQQALAFLESSLSKAPPEDQTFLQAININKALCYAYIGDLVKAAEIALKVDVYLDTHDGKQNYLNAMVSIPWYLIHKKKGWPTEEFEKTITDWLDNHEGSFELEKLFRSVKD